MSRSFGIKAWEIEEAAALGWIRIETRKPPVGRPSRFVHLIQNVSTIPPAKLPPWREFVPRDFKMAHYLFARECGKHRGIGHRSRRRSRRRFPAAVHAYLVTYPGARSYAGARASASRLMKRHDVKILLHWFRIQSCRPSAKACPSTLAEFIDDVSPSRS